MTKYPILVVMAMLLFTSCEKDDGYIDPDIIYSQYELYYNAKADKTVIRARLSFGSPEGELISLIDPASIMFNGQKLLFDQSKGEHILQYQGKVNSGMFTYIDFDGETYTVAAPDVPGVEIPTKALSIDKSRDMVFEWEGDPVGVGETIKLTLEGAQKAIEFLISEPGATEIFISSEELKSIDRFGSGIIKLQRTHSEFLYLGTATGGTITLRHIVEDFVEFH